MVADELKEMKETSLASSPNRYLHPDRYVYDDMTGGYYDKVDIEYKQVTLKITDKSGIVRGRTLCFTEDEYLKLQMLFAETKEYEKALLAMPTDKEILSIWTPIYYGSDDTLNQTLWDSFVKEYNALSLEEKVEYKSSGDYYYSELGFEINGSVGMDAFNRRYNVDAKWFPKTAKLMVEAMNRENSYDVTTQLQSLKDNNTQQVYIDIHSNSEGIYQSAQGQAKTYLEALEFLYSCPIVEDGNGILVQISVGSDYHYSYQYYILSHSDFETFCKKINVYIDIEKDELEKPLVDPK